MSDGPSVSADPRARVLAAALALLAGLLAYVSPVQTTASDPALTLVAAQAVVEHGSLALDPYRGDPRCIYDLERDRRLRFHRGSVYYFAPGPQLLAVPFVWAGRLAGLDMLRPADEAWLQNLVSALLIALDGLLLWSLLRRLSSAAPALVISAVLLLGSPLASTLATALWAAAFAVPLTLAALHVVVRVDQGQWRPRALLAALALMAVAYTCRPATACLLPGWAAWAWRARASRRELALHGLAALGALALGALALPYLPRYFSPAKLDPQTPLLLGLYGTLLSPSRGLLVFCPFAVPVLAAAWRARLWRLPLFRLAAVWLGTQVLLLSVKGSWWGGHSYGPRLLTEAVPALGLMAALAWTALAPPRRWWPAAFVAGGAVAIAIHSGQGLWNPAVLAFNRGPDPRSAQALVLWWRYPQFLATEASVVRRDLELQTRRLRPLAPGDEARAMSDQLVFEDFHGWESGLRRAGPDSRLRFRPVGLRPGRGYLVELRGSVLREQPVRLFLRQQPLDEALLAPPEPHAWRIPVAAELLAGEVELRLLSLPRLPPAPAIRARWASPSTACACWRTRPARRNACASTTTAASCAASPTLTTRAAGRGTARPCCVCRAPPAPAPAASSCGPLRSAGSGWRSGATGAWRSGPSTGRPTRSARPTCRRASLAACSRCASPTRAPRRATRDGWACTSWSCAWSPPPRPGGHRNLLSSPTVVSDPTTSGSAPAGNRSWIVAPGTAGTAGARVRGAPG